MTRSGILSSLCLVFTIDRLEGKWAVVEWWGMATTTDVERSLFPTKPKEGERWSVRLISSPSGSGSYNPARHAYRGPFGWLFLPRETEGPPIQATEIRMSQIPNIKPECEEQT